MQIDVFKSEEFGNVQTLKKDGKTLFGATDVAKALGYKNSIKAIGDHCKKVQKVALPHPQSKDKTIEMNMIPEGDIYRLIIKSELPSAEKFESWIFDEVVPSIMKTGKYEIDLKEIPLLLQKNNNTMEKVKELAEITQEQVEAAKEIEEIGYLHLENNLKELFNKHNQLAKQVNDFIVNGNKATGSGVSESFLKRFEKMEKILEGLKLMFLGKK